MLPWIKLVRLENGINRNQMIGSSNYQKVPSENMGKQYDNELPWIFRFILGILKYAYTNKLEIVLGSLFVLISILIVMLMIKR